MPVNKKSSWKKLKKNKLIIYAVLVVFGIVALSYVFFPKFQKEAVVSETIDTTYNPVITPSDFTTEITNKYFTLKQGSRWVYENGNERNEIEVTGETREVMGVTTLVYWDREWKNGVMVEDTRDFLAQDLEGNVWYFGEEVDNYVNGNLSNHNGSWTAGVDGALPGIWMKADPKLGDEFRQEYYPNVAEDMGTVQGINETVTTALGTFTDCVKILDWTPLDPDAQEHKFYCAQAGNMVLIRNLTDGEEVFLTDYLKAN